MATSFPGKQKKNKPPGITPWKEISAKINSVKFHPLSVTEFGFLHRYRDRHITLLTEYYPVSCHDAFQESADGKIMLKSMWYPVTAKDLRRTHVFLCMWRYRNGSKWFIISQTAQIYHCSQQIEVFQSRVAASDRLDDVKSNRKYRIRRSCTYG